MKQLVLFDIDKTLLQGKNYLHKVAFTEGIKKAFGITTSIDKINHQGKTDKQIIIEVLLEEGMKEAVIREKIEMITEEMVRVFQKGIINEKIELSAGVLELLEALKNGGALLGLVTGNLEGIARGKLQKAGINGYFKLGGFGSDDEERSNLVKIAIKRAEDNFGFELDNNVFVLGDTPKDIIAGKKAGVKTIGIAGGSYTQGELEKENPDFTFKDLTFEKEIINAVGIF